MVLKLLKCAALAAVGVLGACGSGGGNAPVSQGPVTIVKGSNPTQLFSHISKQIRNCWLNPRDPVLTKHVFRAEAAASTTGGVTKIIISETAGDQKRGLKAFTIDFNQLSDGTRINAQNHRLQYGLSQKLISDVGYWSQGGVSCDGPGTQSSSDLRGSVSGPRVSR